MATTITLSVGEAGLLHALPGEPLTWTPVLEWVEDPASGKRRPTGPQERDADGLPIWEAQAIAFALRFGSREMVTVGLRMASAARPAADALAMVPVLVGGDR